MLMLVQDYEVGLVGVGDCERAVGGCDTRILILYDTADTREAFRCSVGGIFTGEVFMMSQAECCPELFPLENHEDSLLNED
jgi:hypothetical protein